MKKAVLILIVGVIFVLASYAADTVSSANIVGYKEITILSNQLSLISTALINESNTVAGLFGNLPSGTKIYLWDRVDQNYNVTTKTRAGWSNAGTNTVEIGSGLFISLPSEMQENIVISGEVPVAEMSGIYTANGYSLLSYPYPTDVAFTNTVLAKEALSGDKISLWRNNDWVTYVKTRAGWTGAENLKINFGEAIFYLSTTNAVRNEIRPYTMK
jgi:hypothetical protein